MKAGQVRFTNAEGDAVLTVLNERIAGGAGDLADALGMSPARGERMMAALESAANKLRGAGAAPATAGAGYECDDNGCEWTGMEEPDARAHTRATGHFVWAR